MPRLCLCVVLVVVLQTAPPAASFADDPENTSGRQLDKDDPLYQALLKLRREVDQLRHEIRGDKPTRRVAPSMAPAVVETKPITAPNRARPAAPLPKLEPPVSIAPSKSEHWSFQPLQNPAAPKIHDDSWIRDDLDRFILAPLESVQLKPNPDADRHALIRRVAFDLTGLPPAEAEIHDFVNDPAPLDDAMARLVDKYLASPRFGERWGRHWLDIVRYADSVGRNWNAPFTYAWRYRNYVIDSFNQDKPYDRFLIEQLAGDLLPADDVATRRGNAVATGFLALGPTDIIVPEGEPLMMDRIDEQIDVTTRATLALTVSCARCHDHKYEPVTMRDYYALAGVFYSTQTLSGQRRGNYVAADDLLILPSDAGPRSPIPGVHSMTDISQTHRQGGWREVRFTTDPNLAMGVRDGQPADCPIRLDGEAYKRGPAPARGDFQFAGLQGLQGIAPDSSGRLQLARWIASRDNPLTARVMVNRIWGHLFGRGLVRSVDNFGLSGEEPTHPQLLDHLATRFAKTWSVKSAIRRIALSRAYRQSSAAQAAGQRADPTNQRYWRMNARRLEVEALRDAMLWAAGRLTFDRPEGIQVAGTGGKGKWGVTRSLLEIDAPYRTVYLPVLRSLLPEMYTAFDFPNPTQLQGQREVTTVAPQALFLMNNDFSLACARDAAARLLDGSATTNTQRVRIAYLRLVGRPPDQDEVAASIELLNRLRPSSAGRDAELYRWSALIQALMISGEFRTLL